jgi:pteridine reductase
MEIEGKVGLVTGGGHRVGRALALGLARAGADVAVHYHRSGDAAAETAGAIRSLGRRAETFQADLSHPDAATGLANAVAEALGRLDILVNSASLFESARFHEVTAEAWDRVMAVNLRAPFLLLQATAPLLKASNGVAVNIADLAGTQAWPAFPHHGVSKAGLIHLTRVAARALAPNVRVNCIVPGTVLPPEDYTPEQIEASVERTVLGRIGAPEDVVEALLFLVRSDFATGSIVTVDGGRTLK